MSGSFAWEEKTLAKIAELENNLGCVVISTAAHSTTYGRSNYFSCRNNTHRLWNGSSWQIVNACNYPWIGSMTISCYAPTPTPCPT